MESVNILAESAGAVEAAPPALVPARRGPTLRAKALRGAAWTVGGYGASQALRLVSNLILTRLLFPEAFGLMALVNVVLQGLEMFSDVGIGPSIIQNKRGDDPRFLGTAWTIQAIRGTVLCAACAALAWPMATFYEQPQLRALLAVGGFTALVSGFSSTALVLANRHLALGRITAVEVSSHASGILLMCVWAWFSPSAWALVVGGIWGAATRMVLSHTVLGGPRVRFCWDAHCFRELLSFGRWVFWGTLVTFLSTRSDRLLLGHYFDLKLLGIYSVAFFMSDSLSTLMSSVSHRVLFPAFSQLLREGRSDITGAFYRARLRLHAIALPLCGVLCAAGGGIVDLLYDDRYIMAGAMLQILGLRTALLCATMPSGHLLIAMGRPDYTFWSNLVSAVALFAGVPLFWYLGGVWGVVWAAPLAALPRLLVGWYGLAREGVVSWPREALSIPLFVAGLLAGLVFNGLMDF